MQYLLWKKFNSKRKIWKFLNSHFRSVIFAPCIFSPNFHKIQLHKDIIWTDKFYLYNISPNYKLRFLTNDTINWHNIMLTLYYTLIQSLLEAHNQSQNKHAGMLFFSCSLANLYIIFLNILKMNIIIIIIRFLSVIFSWRTIHVLYLPRK